MFIDYLKNQMKNILVTPMLHDCFIQHHSFHAIAFK